MQWLILTPPDCCSSNALGETFDAKLSNLITSRSFTILRGPIIFDLHVQGIPRTFISVGQALLQANALTGLRKASKLMHMDQMVNGGNVWR